MNLILLLPTILKSFFVPKDSKIFLGVDRFGQLKFGDFQILDKLLCAYSLPP